MIGPEHCFLKELDRLRVAEATDDETLEAFKKLSLLEGIIPALESAHALAYLERIKDEFKKDDLVIVNLSGSGLKDLDIIKKHVEFKTK